MEKKTKKLQLRKETIAVLNGESMTHVVGGIDQEGCFVTGVHYITTEAFIYNDEQCVCQGEYMKCVPIEGDSGLKTRLNCPPPTNNTCRSYCDCPTIATCLTMKNC